MDICLVEIAQSELCILYCTVSLNTHQRHLMKIENVYGKTKSSLPIFHFILNAFNAGIFSKSLDGPKFILCEQKLSSTRKRRRIVLP